MSNAIKVVGRRRREVDRNPEASLRAAMRLLAEMECLNPYPRPRRFLFKAKTWEDYENWKKEQDNPRLW